ncbi:MAG: hypothetical protein C4576_03330 [Desulfobacteraceae bacterium]|nr:MAG: hypothetical protein C4576_03330 [Desulfobacteraceae bacterium]
MVKILKDEHPSLPFASSCEVLSCDGCGFWVRLQFRLHQAIAVSVLTQLELFQSVPVWCPAAGSVAVKDVLFHAGHPFDLALL